MCLFLLFTLLNTFSVKRQHSLRWQQVMVCATSRSMTTLNQFLSNKSDICVTSCFQFFLWQQQLQWLIHTSYWYVDSSFKCTLQWCNEAFFFEKKWVMSVWSSFPASLLARWHQRTITKPHLCSEDDKNLNDFWWEEWESEWWIYLWK